MVVQVGFEPTTACSLFEHTAKDGKTYKTQYYNLDKVIVGYRVKSKNGILVRKWANKILKDYFKDASYNIDYQKITFKEALICG